MPVNLPILEPFIDGSQPLYEAGQQSLTQVLLEGIMADDFPGVALLGIEAYADRLLHVAYTDGTQVFYLDWVPPVPGYVVAYFEPWTTSVGADGEMALNLLHYRGPEAARRAEQIRRLIPMGEAPD